MLTRDDVPPDLTDEDREEMVRIERHAALASFIVSECRSHGMSESQTDNVLYGWSCSWWEKGKLD